MQRSGSRPLDLGNAQPHSCWSCPEDQPSSISTTLGKPLWSGPLLTTTLPSPSAMSPLVFSMWATPGATAALSLSPQMFSENTLKE